MSQLEKGATYLFKIKFKFPKIESFSSTVTDGVLKYCHKFSLEDENGNEHICQICTDSSDDDRVGKAIFIVATIKTFTRQVYTIENVMPRIEEDKIKSVGSTTKQSIVPTIPQPNPMISGTLADRALAHAIAYYGMPGISVPMNDDEDNVEGVLKTAQKFYDWLSAKRQ